MRRFLKQRFNAEDSFDTGPQIGYVVFTELIQLFKMIHNVHFVDILPAVGSLLHAICLQA